MSYEQAIEVLNASPSGTVSDAALLEALEVIIRESGSVHREEHAE
jgi:hypothetical protein